MNYYLLERSLKRKEVGIAFGQTTQLWDMDFIQGIPYIEQLMDLPNWHGKLRNDEFPNFEPRIKFELTEKGKLSDLVQTPMMNANGMLVSPKFKELLENFSLMEHHFYAGQLKVGEAFLEYFWFHPINEYYKWLNYEKSEIYFEVNKDLPIKILSIKDYEKFIGKGYFNIINWQFGENFPNYDLFYIPHYAPKPQFLISELLVKALKKEKITGIEIKETTLSR